MKRLLIPAFTLTLILLTTGFKISGKGENRPTLQSALAGAYYVRTVPSEDFGTSGKTEVFQVSSKGDILLDEYPVFMRGKLYLGWSPLAGKICLVQVCPERITSNDDWNKLSKISRLAFYMGGKETLSYTRKELEEMGLTNKVAHLAHSGAGYYLIHGIRQVPRSNHYGLAIERNITGGRETIMLDITTGKTLANGILK
ncbi:hypothetical protein N9B94_03185 [Verrucomicrobia bacterium]|nr:hypothetical protein [Verrucomicrobiota bacterium]